MIFAMNPKDTIRKLRVIFRILIDLVPFSILFRFSNQPNTDLLSPRSISLKTILTIDGFPRSANTFSFYHIISFIPGVLIAHHRHTWQQIFLSCLLGKPTFVLIRNPQDAVSSLITKKQYYTPFIAYLEYLVFYFPLLLFSGYQVIPFQLAIDPLLLRQYFISQNCLSPSLFTQLDDENVSRLMRSRTNHKNKATAPVENDSFLYRFMLGISEKVYQALLSRVVYYKSFVLPD